MKLRYLVILLLFIPLAFAANDPGHDTLYVLRLGDTNVTGSINITENLTANIIRAATLLYGNQIDIRANGTIQTVSSRPAIQADSSDLYVDANGNLYLNTKGGTSGIIQVGPVTGNGITLNVSGVIRQQNVLVCLANGTNCVSGNNTGNVSTVTAGSGLSNSGTESNPVIDVNAGDGIVVSNDRVIINNATVCRSDGTGCPASSATSSAGGWQNTSSLVTLASNTTNVSIGNTTGNTAVLFVDTTNQRVNLGADAGLSRSGTNEIAIGNSSAYGNILVGGSLNSPSVRFSGCGSACGIYAVQASQLQFTAGGAGGPVMNVNGGTANGLGLGNAGEIRWTSGNAAFAGADASIGRNGTSTLIITNGTIGTPGYGNISLNNLNAQGNILTAGTVRISSTGVGTFASGTTINSLNVCLSDGTNCPAIASSSAGGWQNTTTLVTLASNTTNVSIGNTTGSVPVLFVDNRNGRIGIGTSSPSRDLDVNNAGSFRFTRSINNPNTFLDMTIDNQGAATFIFNGSNSFNTFSAIAASVDGDYAYFTFKADSSQAPGGHQRTLVVNGTNNGDPFVVYRQSTPIIDVNANRNAVGIRTLSPSTELDVNGSLNLSGNSGTLYIPNGALNVGNATVISSARVGTFASGTTVNSLNICLADGTNCPAIASSSAGGWQNTSSLVTLASNTTNVSVGNTTGSVPILFIDSKNGRVGFSTQTPGALVDIAGTLNATTIQTGGTTRISSSGVGTFATGTTVNSQNICLADGTNCPASSTSSAAGWQNTTSLVTLSTNVTNVSIGNTTGTVPVLFVDNTNGRVGVGKMPTVALDVAGAAVFGSSVTLSQGTLSVTSSSTTTLLIYPPTSNGGYFGNSGSMGTNEIGFYEGGGDGLIAGYDASNTRYAYGGGALLVNSSSVGVGTSAGLQTFQVVGTANITGATYLGNTPCAAGQFLTASSTGLLSCSTPTAPANGGWLNNTVKVWLASNATNLSVGYVSSQPVLFADNANGRVGVGTGVPGALLDIAGTLNATTIQTGGTTRISSTGVGTFASTTTINGKAICLGDGTDCGATSNLTITSVLNSQGWQNTSRLVTLTTNTTNVSIGNSSSTTPLIFVDIANNRVGVGSQNPAQLLHVNSSTDANTQVLIENPNRIGTTAAGVAQVKASTAVASFIAHGGGRTIVRYGVTIANYTEILNSAGNGLLIGSNIANPIIFGTNDAERMRITSTGTVQISANTAGGNATGANDLYVASDIEYDGNLYGPGADLAEIIRTSEPLEAGDVVEIDPTGNESVRKSTLAYNVRVAGIVSTAPGIILGKNTGGVPLAISGRVPVKVVNETGPINPGDLLTTSSTPGYAMRCASITDCKGALVGKALGKLEGSNGTVSCLVVLG